ncbi:uncharacterized protein METZ01_LOCUS318127, partial [marine metagenome]
LHGGAVCLVLVLSFALRAIALSERYGDEIKMSGDAAEYQLYAEHVLSPKSVAPADRMPGFPLALTIPFSAIPGTHGALQAWTTVLLSVAAVGMVYWLTRLCVNRGYALLAGLLAAVNPQLVLNAPLGLTEELFIIGMSAVFLLYYRTIYTADASDFSFRHAWLAGAFGAVVTLTRYDAAPAIVPLFFAIAWQIRRRHGWRTTLLRSTPMWVVPILALCAIRWYADLYDFQDITWRTGNRFFWQEFLRGRMPYKYMFYFHIYMRDWLFSYHDLPALVSMVLKSTAYSLLALGEILGGQVALMAAVGGLLLYVRQRRDLAIPSSLGLIVSPQLILGTFHV